MHTSVGSTAVALLKIAMVEHLPLAVAAVKTDHTDNAVVANAKTTTVEDLQPVGAQTNTTNATIGKAVDTANPIPTGWGLIARNRAVFVVMGDQIQILREDGGLL